MGLLNRLKGSEKKGKEDQTDFEDYFKRVLGPTLSMMAFVDAANMIGINSSDLQACLAKTINTHSEQNAKMINDFIMKIDSIIPDEEFKKRVIAKILFVKDYGSFVIENNKLKGTFVTNDNKYELEVQITEKGVIFSTNQGNATILNGKYIEHAGGKHTIIYSQKEQTIYHNVKNGQVDPTSDSYNIKGEREVHVFEKDGIQSFRYNEKKEDNYFLDKNTGEKTLHEPSPFENYLEKEYTWRATNKTLLKKILKKYVYSEADDSFIHNMDSYLIGRNISPEENKIPFGGNFTWFDKELYQKYLTGECTVSDIWENRGDTYQQKLRLANTENKGFTQRD